MSDHHTETSVLVVRLLDKSRFDEESEEAVRIFIEKECQVKTWRSRGTAIYVTVVNSYRPRPEYVLHSVTEHIHAKDYTIWSQSLGALQREALKKKGELSEIERSLDDLYAVLGVYCDEDLYIWFEKKQITVMMPYQSNL